MAILDKATPQDLKRLLQLFPIARLREAWPEIKGTKEELCHLVASSLKPTDIAQFVDDSLSLCKQHVFVFTRDDGRLALPASITDGEKVREVADDHALYITRSVNQVVLKDPLEETTLEFLWPVRIEIRGPYLIVRFVVLEKNLGSYFERSYYIGNRGIDEGDVLEPLVESLTLVSADLHKGVKQLWADGFMDSCRTRYKTPVSLASEIMDEERGIRENKPELYELLSESQLYNTLFFILEGQGRSVEVMSVDPSRGFIAFLRYTDDLGDTDRVIQKILDSN